jgi:hypothetical protein
MVALAAFLASGCKKDITKPVTTPDWPSSYSGNPGLNFTGNVTTMVSPTVNGDAYAVGLLRQSNCSMTEYFVDTASATTSGIPITAVPDYQNNLHSLAGLTTTANQFKNGCTQTMIGSPAANWVYAGQTASGAVIGAGLDLNNNFYYGTLNLTAGTGTYTQVTQIASALSVSTADLNGDGNNDLVVEDTTGVAGNTAGGMWVLLGNGDGTFAAPVQYLNGVTAGSFTLADVNNDGKLDIVVANNSGFTVLPGNGDGTFGAAITSPVGPGYLQFAAADINGDGNLDIVAGNGQTFLGAGNGTFTPGTAVSASGYASGTPVLADFNNDGKVDVAFSKLGGGGVFIFLGNGNGTFTQGASYTSIYGAEYISATDIDGDGNIDLVVGQGNSGALGPDWASAGLSEVLMGNGDGTFQGASMYPGTLASGTYSPLAPTFVVADFNNDGNPDILSAGASSAGLVFSAGNGKGSFAPGVVTAGPFAEALSAALMNGDNNLDAVFINISLVNDLTPSVGVAFGNGNGTFQTPSYYAIPGSPSYAGMALVTGDFNGDGFPDVAISCQTSTGSVLYLYLNDGTGALKPAQQIDTGIGDDQLQAADLNGDGKLDLVVADTGIEASTGSRVQAGEVKVYLGNGDGTFQTPVAYQPSAEVGAIALADVNNDSILDLIVAGSGSGGANPVLSVLPGKGDGTFGTAIQTAQGAATGGGLLAVADFNGDGNPDVLQGGCCGSVWGSVYLGNGNGTFSAQYALANAASVAGVAAVDVNGDGRPDILAAPNEGGGSGVEVFLNLYGSAATTIATTTTLAASPNPATEGQSVTLTATVAASSGSSTPTGTVTFYNGTTVLGTGTLNSGMATYATSSLSVGAQSITASYGGSTTDAASVSTALSVVISATPLASTTTLTSSSGSIASGSSVTLTAVVAPPAGTTAVPTGTVTFLNGTTALGTGTLNGTATATYTTTALPVGTDSITAFYGGDTNFAGSTSAAISVIVGTPAFSLSLSPSSVTIASGASGSSTVTETPAFGFASAISFTCSGLPAYATCSFSPASVTPSGSTASTTTLTIATNVATASLRKNLPGPGPNEPNPLLCILPLGVVGLLGIRRRHRTLSNLLSVWNLSALAVLLLALMSGALMGCGSSGSSTKTPAGTSTVTITASGGGQTQTATLSVTIQ